MNNNRPVIVWLILGVLVIVFAGGAIFYTQTKKMSSSQVPLGLPNQSQLPPGLKKVQMIAETYPKLVKTTLIQQQIEGTLKTSTLNSWTLEQDNQTITLTQEGIIQVQYFKLPKVAPSSTKLSVPVEIKAKDIQIGDRVSIYQTIDYQTGKTTIVGITVLAKD